MRFHCDSCGAKYKIGDEKVAGRLLRFPCRKCDNKILINGKELVVEEPLAAVGGAAVRAPSSVPKPATRRTSSRVRSADADLSGRHPGLAPDLPVRGGAPSLVPAARGEAIWHVSIKDVPVGPMTIEELSHKIDSGAVSEYSLVWQQSFDEWRPLATVPKLMSLLQQRRASVSPRGTFTSIPPAAEVRASQVQMPPLSTAPSQPPMALAGHPASQPPSAFVSQPPTSPVQQLDDPFAAQEPTVVAPPSRSPSVIPHSQPPVQAPRPSFYSQPPINELAGAPTGSHPNIPVASYSQPPHQGSYPGAAYSQPPQQGSYPGAAYSQPPQQGSYPGAAYSQPPTGSHPSIPVAGYAPVHPQAYSQPPMAPLQQTSHSGSFPGFAPGSMHPSAPVLPSPVLGSVHPSGPAMPAPVFGSVHPSAPGMPAPMAGAVVQPMPATAQQERRTPWWVWLLLGLVFAMLLALGGIYFQSRQTPAAPAKPIAPVVQPVVAPTAPAAPSVPLEPMQPAATIEEPPSAVEPAARKMVQEFEPPPKTVKRSPPKKPAVKRIATAPSKPRAPTQKGSGVGFKRLGASSDSKSDEELFAKYGGSDTGPAKIDVGSSKSKSSSKKPLDMQAVQSTVGKNRSELQRCYERALRGQSLESAVKVTVNLNVSASGKVSKASARASGAAPGGLTQCIESRVKRWKFPSSSAGGPARFPVVFTPKN